MKYLAVLFLFLVTSLGAQERCLLALSTPKKLEIIRQVNQLEITLATDQVYQAIINYPQDTGIVDLEMNNLVSQIYRYLGFATQIAEACNDPTLKQQALEMAEFSSDLTSFRIIIRSKIASLEDQEELRHLLYDLFYKSFEKTSNLINVYFE